ncbi:MAG: YybS family protein [Paenisporosarcina sp.]
MPNEHTKRLTLGAMMIALFTILLAVSFYVPILNIVTTFFIALPIAWYSAKFNRKESALVTILSIGMAFFVGGLVALPLAMIHAPLGFVMGDAIRTKKSKLYLLMASGMTFLISTVIQYVITVTFFNINPIQEFLSLMRESYEQTGRILDEFDTLPKGYNKLVEETLFMFETVLPSIIIIAIFVSAFSIIIINLPILKRLGLEVPKFKPFREMRLPKAVLWYYLVVLIVTLFVELDKGTFAFMVFANATVVLRGLLLLQGVSIIHYYIHVQGWPKWVMVVATVLAFPLQSFTILLGVFDLGFNIRSLIKDMNRK